MVLNMNRIEKFVRKIIKKYRTRSPFEICDKMGIKTLSYDLPEGVNALLVNVFSNYVIVINSNIDIVNHSIICAHELGHILLHKTTTSIQLERDSSAFVSKNDLEADYFANCLLEKNTLQSVKCINVSTLNKCLKQINFFILFFLFDKIVMIV